MKELSLERLDGYIKLQIHYNFAEFHRTVESIEKSRLEGTSGDLVQCSVQSRALD